MSGSRPSLFDDENETDIDLAQFAPRLKPNVPPVPAEEMRRLSEASGFPSRAPLSAANMQTVSNLPTVNNSPLPVRRAVKTGRTELLNARIRPQAHSRYHEILSAQQTRFEAGELSHKPTLGEIVELALAALEREIAEGRHG